MNTEADAPEIRREGTVQYAAEQIAMKQAMADGLRGVVIHGVDAPPADPPANQHQGVINRLREAMRVWYEHGTDRLMCDTIESIIRELEATP